MALVGGMVRWCRAVLVRRVEVSTCILLNNKAPFVALAGRMGRWCLTVLVRHVDVSTCIPQDGKTPVMAIV